MPDRHSSFHVDDAYQEDDDENRFLGFKIPAKRIMAKKVMKMPGAFQSIYSINTALMTPS
ncbi:MAG: hypothetical protein STSR0009_14890 [Methanoregula sp.]